MTTAEIIFWQKKRLQENVFKIRTEDISRLADEIAHLEEVLLDIDLHFDFPPPEWGAPKGETT